ncbi:MAG: ABC-three component system protein [Panacagrimonas sp.]
MKSRPHTIPLQSPESGRATPADIVAAGLPIPPIERIRIFSDKQWEEFVLEWADSLRESYGLVERCGGAGDMGRDIVAYDVAAPSIWDNYQCKHYKDSLTPSVVWLELGKLVHFTRCGEYTYPRRYFFVAPQGAGTKLSNLLKKPDELKAQLLEHWDDHCRLSITSKAAIDLDGPLRSYISSLDFSNFSAIPPLRIIDQHAKTRWHAARFGGGLPARPRISAPPTAISEHEVNYVKELLDAYSDHLRRVVASVDELVSGSDVHGHFNDSRLEFYSAEALRTFSRDTLPPGAFEVLQDEMHAGIKDEFRGVHTDAYYRLMAVVKTARLLPITDHALKERLSLLDRGGICHQLANDKKVRWVK